jgi:hypothetical protein
VTTGVFGRVTKAGPESAGGAGVGLAGYSNLAMRRATHCSSAPFPTTQLTAEQIGWLLQGCTL